MYLQIVIQTHYITFQDINLQPYFKMTCVKSVLWPVLVSDVVDVSLSGGILGYWTACNNIKRYCTVPYCVHLPQEKIDNLADSDSRKLVSATPINVPTICILYPMKHTYHFCFVVSCFGYIFISTAYLYYSGLLPSMIRVKLTSTKPQHNKHKKTFGN